MPTEPNPIPKKVSQTEALLFAIIATALIVAIIGFVMKNKAMGFFSLSIFFFGIVILIQINKKK